MANLFVHIFRAIGQASMTKEYLESVRQGEVCLPDGPVFLNPDSLIHALKREVRMSRGVYVSYTPEKRVVLV